MIKKHKMKQLIRVILLCIMVQACGQTENKTENLMEVDKIRKYKIEWISSIKKYKKEPYYKIHTGSPQYCNYEILVNDLPVHTSYSGFKDLTGTPINRAILKSGEQRITIKIFPPEKDSILSKQANMYFKLVEVDHMTNQFEEKKILSFVLPSDDDGNFVGAGLPYFEKTIVFNATILYELTGWSESEDLSKLNKEVLKEMVLDFYKKRGDIQLAKDYAQDFSLSFNKFKETGISNYEIANEFEGILHEVKRFSEYGKRFKLTEPCTMKLYGDNRLAILEILIGENKGDAAYSLFVEKGEQSGYNTITFYLHIPKGKTALEIIR